MEVTPEAVRDGKFREALRGYNRDDVDEFLERVAAGIALLQERIREATERASRVEAQATEAAELDDSLRRTLVLAQRTADLAVSEARREASQLLEEAQAAHEQMTRELAADRERLTEETQKAVRDEIVALHETRERLTADIAALGEYYDRQREWLRTSLVNQLRALDEGELDPGDRPAVSDIDPAFLEPVPNGAAPGGVRETDGTAAEVVDVSDSIDVHEGGGAELDDTADGHADEQANGEYAERRNDEMGPNTAAMFLSELQRVIDSHEAGSDDDVLPPPDERARAFFDEDDTEGARRFGGIRRRRRRS